MKDEYPICTPGAPVSVPQMTDDEIREGLVAAGAVVMKGCECGGRFERVVVRHLHGLRCLKCGMEAFES
ncbi:MAG TPA: hypothetical protein EYP67_00455 [Methanosarcinales archaeon]|nr:hypothetical protein [Methanosarcinales archaeon]